jgi:general secretion pathway protein D
LKPTARILTGSIALLLGWTLAVAHAEQPPVGSQPATYPQNANGGGARQQSDSLLARARQAIQENNFAAADTLITQAETLGVKYGMLSTAYTPSKARAELQQKAQASQAPRSGLFGMGARNVAAPNDPFQGMPAPEGLQPLPAVANASPIGARAQSDQQLLTARRHLAVGDVNQANRSLEEAKRLNVRYSPLEDTPARVEALVASYDDVMAQQTQRGQTEGVRRMLAKCLLDQSEGLLRWHDYDEAERLAMEAGRMNVPFNVYESNPQSLLEKIAAQRQRDSVQLAGHVAPATGPYPTTGANQALYNPTNDPTRNMLVQGTQPVGPSPTLAAPPTGPQAAPQSVAPSRGFQLFQQGEAALRAHDTQGARSFFQQAAAFSHELDPFTQQKLQDMLQLLAINRPATQGPGGQPSIIDDAAAKAALLARQVSVDIAQQTREAERLRQADPNAAIKLLEETKARVEGSGLEPASRDRLLRQVDRALIDTANYIEENKPRIELDQRNRAVLEQIEQERQMTLDRQQKLKELVDRYNMLINEQRFAEAEVVAKRAKEIAPNEMIATQLAMTSQMIRRHAANEEIRASKEEGFVAAMMGVDKASIPINDYDSYQFGDDWDAITAARKGLDNGRQRTEGEMEIQRRLETPVLLEFNGEPLSAVIDYLSKLAEVNVYLDPQGLQQEAVTTDMPVSITLSQEVTLKSALKLILEPLHLSYVIEDEVLKITSEQMRSGDTYIDTYNVADLVIPIPNFTPSNNQGLAGAYNDAMRRVSFNGGGGFGGGLMGSPLAVMANRTGAKASAGIDPSILAQMTGGGGAMGGGMPQTMPMGMGGPGGAGGASMADFDSLISLITATVQPESWEDVGGPGTVAPFETNLSLVIRQTEEVHEEIVDLLEQLRRMQDLQVTIEVRFITLNDNFFERIGVDFDFDIDDDIDRPFQVFGRTIDREGDDFDGTEPQRNTLDVDHDRSVTVGMSQPGVFSADLDVPFQQGSFQLAVPQFGGFDATAGAQLGFAILSEIEAFFFINAAQGDRRSNIMQAPKVTLFNGQQAFVSDTSQSPFVVSVVPVVGDFAAAQQPVIVVLNEGTFMTVQAVVSDDRRFVRLTVVPVFSKIGEVNTFQFTGSRTTTESTEADGVQDTPNDNTKRAATNQTSSSGTTVQLPTYSFISVTTTVSVPDGGTVLLGGIKRLSEGRNEFGVPMLNKLPYINRLFKNVGIGRETQSLMMMVTPRIIIQEEEEERLGIYSR